MLKGSTRSLGVPRSYQTITRLPMFQRASSSVATQKQVSYQNQPFKLSQTPLSPTKSSFINVRKTSHGSKVRSDIREMSSGKGHVLLEAIQDTAAHKYRPHQACPDQASDAVYFNEDDFDDDLELNFDSVAKVGSRDTPMQDHSSSSISWPPSSYAIRSSPTVAKGESTIENMLQSEEAPEQMGQSIPEVEKVSANYRSMPIPKKPRLLPWAKESSTTSSQGPPRDMQKRHGSTAAAILPKDEADDYHKSDESQQTRYKNPHEMTQSAVKLAIKGRGKKRNSEEMDAPQMQINSHKATGASDVAKVFLSAEQRGVIELLKTGRSVFFTGSAGTGKSVLLRTAIQELRTKYKQLEKVAVTASTGLAACNIGGVTLHSFAGVGLGRDSVNEMVKKVKRNKKNVLKWTKTKVLIIDEISMVDAEFYDKLEAVARKLRANDRPWGGIQIVATGDFFQLPPVPDQGKIAKFAFEAEKWKELDATIQLTTVFRQKDEDFVEMLNQMRTGSLTAKTIENFRLLQRPLTHNDGIIPTELFPTRHEVDNANAMRMRLLPGETKAFDAEDSGTILDLQQRAKLLANCMAPVRLDLKTGAQVMLIKNRDDGLVNGSLGVVVGFMNEKTYTYATDGGEAPFDSQILRDSPWTEEEIALMDGSPSGKRKLKKMMDMQNTAATQKVWPVVRFRSPNGGQDITQLMSPESWKIEQPNGEVQACRRQVPLILAYAISIHKAQGQTIERVKVDLGKVFEKGQAYVALSRAVSKDGLQILRFDAKRVMAHPKVAAFYRELGNADDAIERNQALKRERSVEIEEEDLWNANMTTQEVFSQIKREPLLAYKTVPARGKSGKVW